MKFSAFRRFPSAAALAVAALSGSAALASFAFAPHVANAAVVDWDVDTAHSRVGFGVKHLMVSTTRGTFAKFTGNVAIDDKDITKSVIRVDIESASIDTQNAKRDEHLRSADFFDVAKFPKLTFQSTKVEKDKQSDKLFATGDLTIRGVTKSVVLTVSPLTAEVKDPWGGVRRGATASTKINRKDFGLTWNKALEAGGVTVGDEIAIDLEVELIKKK